MILKGQEKKSTNSITSIVIFMLLAAGIIFIAKFAGTEKVAEPTNNAIICDAENIEGDYFVSDVAKFSGAKGRTDANKHTGDYSLLLNKNQREGMEYSLVAPRPGDTYKASIWKYSKNADQGFLAIESDDKKLLALRENKNREHNENFWTKVVLVFTIPQDTFIKSVRIFALNEGPEDIFFDDLQIEKIAENEKAIGEEGYFGKTIRLFIENESKDKLAQQRAKAIREGIFMRDQDSEVRAAILDGGKKNEISLRYKGDWLDHILSGQPSYRIETKGDFVWNGMQSFSIQHPRTRGFLREWVYHDLLTQEQILSPRYDFIKVNINSEDTRVYALEEHFNKFLVEYKKRREGPIIKFTEDAYWESMVRYIGQNKKIAPIESKNRALATSEIVPFKAKRTMQDSNLAKQYAIGQNLVNRYRNGEGKVSDIFDIDKMARFLALSELCMAGHSLTWHNQRFYYNPIISLLEPVGFDCSRVGDDINAFGEPLEIELALIKFHAGVEPINRLYADKEFLVLFFYYLHQYSTSDFTETYLATRRQDIDKREQLLRLARKGYTYNRVELIDRAKKIQITLPPHENALRVYGDGFVSGKRVLKFLNTHTLPLEVKIAGEADVTSFIVMPEMELAVPNYHERLVPSDIKKVEYRLPGKSTWTTANISAWPSPGFRVPRTDLFETHSLSDTTLFSIEEGSNLVYIKKGQHNIASRIVIPSGYIVHIAPGTVFEFLKDGAIISNSAMNAVGTSEDPIRFKGNGKNGSLTILQADKKSNFNQVIFDNQNTFSYEGWKLTGAVTFYESDVDISDCKFINNTCEDALNIVRSRFTVTRAEFINIFSDAFDADFCEGTISESSFQNTGNDAIDFSNSVIKVRYCQMHDIGDKGISAGEQATVDASDIKVERANIAFASKDKSILTLHNIQIRDCDKGFAAYQKKPEFGPATIKLSKFEEENVQNLFLIEAGSTLIK